MSEPLRFQSLTSFPVSSLCLIFWISTYAFSYCSSNMSVPMLHTMMILGSPSETVNPQYTLSSTGFLGNGYSNRKLRYHPVKCILDPLDPSENPLFKTISLERRVTPECIQYSSVYTQTKDGIICPSVARHL